LIQLFHVGKHYPGGQTALDDISVEIPRGQFVFLTGASGAGKTTLLKMIFREEVPTTGQILVNGRNVSSIPPRKVPFLRRSIGVVFQDFRLIARKTVFENVAYLPRILGLDTRTQKKVAYQALRRVGLAHRMNAFPPELSGGEQQRVAIARALINEPEILIADEPTGNLDPDLSREILRLFLEVNLRGTTVILATHDRDTIERVGRRVLTLHAGRLVSDVELEGTDPPRLDLPPEIGDGQGEDGPGAAVEDQWRPRLLLPGDDEEVRPLVPGGGISDSGPGMAPALPLDRPERGSAPGVGLATEAEAAGASPGTAAVAADSPAPSPASSPPAPSLPASPDSTPEAAP
jgi:cell division transport system ATP-binding protein